VTDATTDFSAFAGDVLFPRSGADLTDTTRCPACLAPLESAVCDRCDLDLNHPASVTLAATSRSAAELLDRRIALIGRIRHETAAQPVHTFDAVPALQVADVPSLTNDAGTGLPASAPASALPAQAPFPQPFDGGATNSPAAPASAPPTTGVAATSAGPGKPKRSSIQVILVVLGVALLSVAAIFCLIFAVFLFNLIGLIGQSILIAGVTAAAFAVASTLRRRKLNSTAEGIAVFAVVLTYLDVYALRANNLFGTGDSEPVVYWGAALVLSSVGFVLWNRAAHLRAPSVIAAAAWPLGAGLLAGGIAIPLDGGGSLFVGAIVAALAALAHPLTSRLSVPPGSSRGLERLLVMTAGGIALLMGFFTAFTVTGVSGSVIALVLLALVAAAHATLASLTSSNRQRTPAGSAFGTFGIASAALAAISLSLTGAAYAIHSPTEYSGFFWAPLVAVAVALAFDVLARRRETPSAASSPALPLLRAALLCSAGVAFLAALVPAILASIAVGGVLASALPALLLAAPETRALPGSPIAHEASVSALAAVCALATISWSASRMLRSRRLVLGWAIAVTVVLAVGLVGSAVLATALWLALAAGALAVLASRLVPAAAAGSVRWPVAVTAAIATALGFITSWADSTAWIWGTVATLALLVGARWLLRPLSAPTGAVLLGSAIVVALGGVGAWGHVTGDPSGGVPLASLGWLRFVAVAAVVLLAALSVPARLPLTALERRTAFWITAPAAGATVIAPALLSPPLAASAAAAPLVGLLTALALLGALLLWAVPRAAPKLRIEQFAAGAALAPIATVAAVAFSRLVGLPEFAGSVAPATAAVLVSAGAFAASRTSGRQRIARDLGITAVVVPTVLFAISTDSTVWLVLLLAAISTLFLAVSPDGIFASASPRRYLGWLALALAVSGLWWRLGELRIGAIELYVLPVAGVLLALAALAHRSERRRARLSEPAAGARAIAPYLFLGGLLVALLPLAVASTQDGPARALTVGGVSAVLLLIGTGLRGRMPFRAYLDAAAAAGAVGVATVAIGRAAAVTVGSDGNAGPELDAWLGAGCLLLVLAAAGLVRPRSDESAAIRLRIAEIVGIVAFSAVLVLEAANFSSPLYGAVRAVAVVLLFAIIHVVVVATAKGPFTPRVGWLVIVLAGIAAIMALLGAAVEPMEILTLPIALALAVTGALALERSPAARSWPYLGPATLVLLVPTLLATAVDRPLWRLVALGVVAVAVVVVGLQRRLQAPFVIGSAVTLVHAVATFSGGIRAVYMAVPWWLWLAVGGILLIVLAARYERQVQNVRAVALRVAALR